nr:MULTISPECIES: hypothetical protein [Rhizobium]
MRSQRPSEAKRAAWTRKHWASGPAGNCLQHLQLQDAGRDWSLGETSIHWHSVFAALGQLDSNPRLIIKIKDKPKSRLSMPIRLDGP